MAFLSDVAVPVALDTSTPKARVKCGATVILLFCVTCVMLSSTIACLGQWARTHPLQGKGLSVPAAIGHLSPIVPPKPANGHASPG